MSTGWVFNRIQNFVNSRTANNKINPTYQTMLAQERSEVFMRDLSFHKWHPFEKLRNIVWFHNDFLVAPLIDLNGPKTIPIVVEQRRFKGLTVQEIWSQ